MFHIKQYCLWKWFSVDPTRIWVDRESSGVAANAIIIPTVFVRWTCECCYIECAYVFLCIEIEWQFLEWCAHARSGPSSFARHDMLSTLSRSSNASHEKRVFRWKKCSQHVAIKRDTQKEQTKLQLLIKCVYISVWCFWISVLTETVCAAYTAIIVGTFFHW